jgi:hypothetical protein
MAAASTIFSPGLILSLPTRIRSMITTRSASIDTIDIDMALQAAPTIALATM